MDELGKDLIESGIGNVIGEIAGSSSGGVGNILKLADQYYEQYGDAKEKETHFHFFIIHLAHRDKGIDYNSDCKICNP